MGKLFTVADLLCVMQFLYPEVEDERDDDENYEHPMTGVGLVLLSAALLETIEPGQLILFTGYSREFVSSIGLNMQNNKLWIDGRYDVSRNPSNLAFIAFAPVLGNGFLFFLYIELALCRRNHR